MTLSAKCVNLPWMGSPAGGGGLWGASSHIQRTLGLPQYYPTSTLPPQYQTTNTTTTPPHTTTTMKLPPHNNTTTLPPHKIIIKQNTSTTYRNEKNCSHKMYLSIFSSTLPEIDLSKF